MLEVKIADSTIPRTLKTKVLFPNLSEYAGVNPTVDMIVTDTGEALFDVVQLLFAITDYSNGVHGPYQNCIRDIIRSTGRFVFGSVVLFRRGSYFANIGAAKHIVSHILDKRTNTTKLRSIEHTAVYESLMSCPSNKYSDMQTVPASSRVPVTSLPSVVPSSIEVNKRGIVGTVIPVSEQVSEEPESTQSNSEPEQPVMDSPEPSQPAAAPQTDDMELSLTATSIPEVLSQLLGSMLKGKKIKLTLSIE